MDCVLKQFLAFAKLIIIVCTYHTIRIHYDSRKGLNPEHNVDVMSAQELFGLVKKRLLI